MKSGQILHSFRDPDDGELVVLRYRTPKARQRLFRRDALTLQQILEIQASMEADRFDA